MVRHIVCWNLKDEAEGNTKEENFAIIKAGLEALVGKVEGLNKAEVGRGYSEGGYDMCLYSELEDRAALERYQIAPEHLKVKEFVHKVIANRVACDVDCG